MNKRVGSRDNKLPPPDADDGNTEPEEGRRPQTTRPPPRRAPAETKIANEIDPDALEDPPSNEDDEDATAAGPPMSIEIIHGPDEGKKKRIKGGRMVVGRGDGCDFKLIDTSASRRHLEVIVGSSGAVVRDLGSGNGTKLNGERIDEARLDHGDEITLGVTVMRVVDEMKALEERRKPKAPEPPPDVEPHDPEAEISTGSTKAPSLQPSGTESVEIPGRTPGRRSGTNPALLAALGLGGILVVGLFVLVLRPTHPAEAVPPSVSNGDKISALVAKAKTALLAADYDSATADIAAALTLDPANETALEYQKRINAEKEGATKLSVGLAQATANDFDSARKTLADIPPDTNASDKAAAALKDMDGKELTYRVGQANAALAENHPDGAEASLARVTQLSAGQGDTLSKAIAAKRKELAIEERKEANSVAYQRRKKKEKKLAKASAAVRAELDPGYRKFESGDFERASSEFERISESSKNAEARSRAHDLAKAVRVFNNEYKAAEEQEASKAFEAEIKPLGLAIAAYKDIDPDGPLIGKLTTRMASALVMKGRNASARQDYGVAVKAFRSSMSYRPNQDAKDGLNELRSHAHEVYIQAYEEEGRDADSARKLYEAVESMLNPGDEDYEKAKRRLASMNGGG